MNLKRLVVGVSVCVCIITIFQFKRFVHYDIKKAIRYKNKSAEFDLVQVQRASRSFPNITSHVSQMGSIDAERTVALAKTASRLLSKRWWRGRTCNCERPIADFIMGTPPAAKTHTYWTEAFMKRTVISLAHHDFRRVSSGPLSISLLTQMSANRIEMLDLIARRWQGPINLAIYVKPSQFTNVYANISNYLMTSMRRNVIAHLVVAEGELYPVNWLRNLVIRNTTSEYVFMIDGDFVPSIDLERQLKLKFQKLSQEKNDNTLVVVPAFEIVDEAVNFIPRDKRALLELMESGQADVFHRAHYPDGHSLWKYDKWKSATKSYLLYHVTACSQKAEPYIALKRSQSPYLPEILLERGRNKVAYYFELCNAGKRFEVLSNEFLVHKLHSSTTAQLNKVSVCVFDAWEVFRTYIAKKYKKTHVYQTTFSEDVHTFRSIVGCLLGDFIFCLCILVPVITLLYLITYRSC